ncbi:hypothetical protein GQX74_011610 [Glossina fuscipes]|nr:hypothetical protein GQX74_011610 [Glossina fuscipes]
MFNKQHSDWIIVKKRLVGARSFEIRLLNKNILHCSPQGLLEQKMSPIFPFLIAHIAVGHSARLLDYNCIRLIHRFDWLDLSIFRLASLPYFGCFGFSLLNFIFQQQLPTMCTEHLRTRLRATKSQRFREQVLKTLY